jgi:hypothetical protein
MFQKVLLRGDLGRIIVPPSIVRRIEAEERFRPGKANYQILLIFVFDNLPKPTVGVEPICESFPGVSSKGFQGACSSESP